MQESTKRHILIIAIVVSLLPAILLPQPPSMISASSISLYVSAIFGYTGVVLLLWMYIIGAKGLFGIFFEDLAPVLKIHKWIGKYGTLAIFVHPLLITFSYGESLLYSFIPLSNTWTERHILLGQIAFWLLLLIWFLSALIRDKLNWRVWRYLHMLAYICVPFVLLHIPDLGSQQRAHALVNAYFMMLVATFIVITVIRLVSLFNLDRTKYRITRHIRLTAIDYMLRLEPVGSRRLAPRFGQYLYIKLGFMSEDHPFSVTQYDPASGAITITYRLAGMYTRQMATSQEGDIVLLSGPYGSFMGDIADESTPIVYLAGGIGITPFMGPILQDGTNQWLFSANRTRDLALFGKHLKDSLGTRVISVYSRVDGEPKPQEEMGYISADMLQKYLGDLGKYRYYLCGPPAMMQSMRSMLYSAGIPTRNVHSEEFGW